MSATWIAAELGYALAPLRVAVEDRTQFIGLLRRLGWNVEVTDEQMDAVNRVLPVVRSLEVVSDILADLEADGSVSVADAATLVAETAAALAAVRDLAGTAPADLADLPAPLDEPEFWAELSTDLLEYVLVEYLKARASVLYALLAAGGVLERAEPVRGLHDQRINLSWDRLLDLATDPAGQLAATYGWGDAFDFGGLLGALSEAARSLGWSARYRPVRPPLKELFFPDSAPGVDRPELDLSLVEADTADGMARVEAGLLLLPVPAEGGTAQDDPEGLYVGTFAEGGAGTGIDLGSGWTLSVDPGIDTAGLFGFVLRPSGTRFASASPFIEGGLAVDGAPSAPWILLGDADGTRLELTGVHVAVGASGSVSDPEFFFELGTLGDGLRLVLEFGEADGFIREVLGEAPLGVSVGLVPRWSSAHGLTVSGSAGFDITIPINLSLTVFWVESARIRVAVDGDGVVAEGSVVAGLELGPFQLSVEGVGLAASLREAADGTGSLGKMDVALAFKPPEGLGASLDAEVVKGGGYLYHDPDKGEYAGAIQLEALGFGLAATGILLTDLDGGGWSLIVTISATFTGVQLGFGFTLDGVGGLLGLHRSFATEVLQAGLKDGSLDAVLYPDDPVGDAPMILETLADAFPPVRDQYVFGPTVKIGWAGMLSAELGVIFEIPDPVKVALLGQLEIGMPFLGSPLVELHMDTLGVLDLGAGELAIDVSLYDSNVVGYALDGDLAIRLNWLGQPSFTLAAGGFHPAYPAPPGFPTLRRMSISLDTGGNPLIRIEGYFAITSNSVQFGAHFDFFMEMATFTIEAWAGFDVLLLFSPFQMRVDLELGATVAAAGVTLLGVDLAVAVSGPKPWEVSGSASFKLLGLKTEFNVDLTLPPHGEPEEIEAVSASDLVLDSLSNPQNWVPALPEGVVSGVVFAPAYEVGDGLLVHPGGRVDIRQKAVPLGEDVELVGTAEVEGANHFLITAVEVVQDDGTATPLPSGDWSPLDDWFAPGQFFEMSDAAKLEGPSFEKMQAGVTLGGTGVEAGTGVDAPFEYETGIIDPSVEATFPGTARPILDRFQLPEADQLVLASVGSKALAGLGEPARAPLVATSAPVWTAASTDDLSPVTLSTTSTSRVGLAAAAARQSEHGAVQVVPAHETQGAGVDG